MNNIKPLIVGSLLILGLLLSFFLRNSRAAELTVNTFGLADTNVISYATPSASNDTFANTGLELINFVNNYSETMYVLITTSIQSSFGDYKEYYTAVSKIPGKNNKLIGYFNRYRFNNSSGYVVIDYADSQQNTAAQGQLNSCSVAVIKRTN